MTLTPEQITFLENMNPELRRELLRALDPSMEKPIPADNPEIMVDMFLPNTKREETGDTVLVTALTDGEGEQHYPFVVRLFGVRDPSKYQPENVVVRAKITPANSDIEIGVPSSDIEKLHISAAINNEPELDGHSWKYTGVLTIGEGQDKWNVFNAFKDVTTEEIKLTIPVIMARDDKTGASEEMYFKLIKKGKTQEDIIQETKAANKDTGEQEYSLDKVAENYNAAYEGCSGNIDEAQKAFFEKYPLYSTVILEKGALVKGKGKGLWALKAPGGGYYIVPSFTAIQKGVPEEFAAFKIAFDMPQITTLLTRTIDRAAFAVKGRYRWFGTFFTIRNKGRIKRID